MQRHVSIVAEYYFLEFTMFILKVTLYMQHVKHYNIFQEQKVEPFPFWFQFFVSMSQTILFHVFVFSGYE